MDYCASRDGIGPLFVPAVAGWAWHSFELTECADVTIDYCGAYTDQSARPSW